MDIESNAQHDSPAASPDHRFNGSQFLNVSKIQRYDPELGEGEITE